MSAEAGWKRPTVRSNLFGMKDGIHMQQSYKIKEAYLHFFVTYNSNVLSDISMKMP